MLSMQLKLCKKNVDWCKDQGALANELLYTVKAYYLGCGVEVLLCDYKWMGIYVVVGVEDAGWSSHPIDRFEVLTLKLVSSILQKGKFI